MKKYILLFSFLSCCVMLFAVSDVTNLIICKYDGTQDVYSLAETPRVIVNENKLELVTSTFSTIYEVDDVAKFIYADIPNGIDSVSVDNNMLIKQQGDYVIVSNPQRDLVVNIYSIEGKLFSSTKCGKSTTTRISIHNIKNGVYFVSYDNTTIKSLKK